MDRERPPSVGIGLGDKEFTVFALVDRPEHTAVLGRIFTSWSIIEGVISTILGVLMNAPGEVAVELLSTYPNNRSKVEAVRKVAKRVLPKAEFVDFEKLMKDAVGYSEQRNQIAHCLWGKNRDEPDLIYRAPVKVISDSFIHMREPLPNEDMKKHFDGIRSFTVGQLEEIENQGAQLLVRLMEELTRLPFKFAHARVPISGMPES